MQLDPLRGRTGGRDQRSIGGTRQFRIRTCRLLTRRRRAAHGLSIFSSAAPAASVMEHSAINVATRFLVCMMCCLTGTEPIVSVHK